MTDKRLTPTPFEAFVDPPHRDTEPSSDPPEDETIERGTLAGFNASLERLEVILSENDRTVKRALHELGTLVVEHYQRSTARVDALSLRQTETEARVTAVEKRLEALHGSDASAASASS